MGYASLGAAGVMPMVEPPAARLAAHLADIRRRKGCLQIDEVRAFGWRDDELAAHLGEALECLRAKCRSHWPTCPEAIVVDGGLTALIVGAGRG